MLIKYTAENVKSSLKVKKMAYSLRAEERQRSRTMIDDHLATRELSSRSH